MLSRMVRWCLICLLLFALSSTLSLVGCGNSGVDLTCAQVWENITDTYADATQLKSCDGVDGAKKIVDSLMNLDGLTINNNGLTMTPCIQTRCDANYVYVASNALPHYDFVQTTPNALVANLNVFRLPLKPQIIPASTQAQNFASIKGCQAAYTQFLDNANRATQQEPSGYCYMGNNAAKYMAVTMGSAKAVVHKVPCLNTMAFMINGVPLFSPNEGPMPDPWGNPFFKTPVKAGEIDSSVDGAEAAMLDMCLAHTANTMHHHGANPACYERNADGKPKNSYAAASASWDMKAMLDGDCTKESGIVGWHMDGVPIKGPCVCLKRGSDGTCVEVKRVRSAWAYRGLKDWGSAAKEAEVLGTEGKACAKNSDCCTQANGCKYRCSYSIFEDSKAPGGTVAAKRCLLLDYSWCTHKYVSRAKTDVSKANFVYLDVCNGYEGADGYAYHFTGSFPLAPSCYRYAPTDSISAGRP